MVLMAGPPRDSGCDRWAGQVGGAHRLVEGQDVAQFRDGAVAVLGGDREQVVRARRVAALAPLDVVADERGDQ
jgi:hypothetical protein